MDKGSMPAIIGVLVIGYIFFFIANFIYLKSTIEPVPVDTTEYVEEAGDFDELDLTWDITGEQGVRQSRREDQERILREQREQMTAVADSIIVEETTPIEEQLEETREQLAQVQEDTGGLEALLASLAATADSVDQADARRLSSILAGMRPQNAAQIMGRLAPRTNAELLLRMRQRQAANILAQMPREQAADIARYLSRAYAGSTI